LSPPFGKRELAICASVILFAFSAQPLRCPGLPLLGRDELAIMALGPKIAAQTVGNLADVDAVILLVSGSDGP
jgi:hypothetical protein